MNATQIKNIIEDNRNKYNYFGLRAMTSNPITGETVILSVGDMPANSYHWDDGESTGKEINGVCALGIETDDTLTQIGKVIDNISIYHSNQIVLIGSLGCDYGDDAGEIILRNSETVLHEWKRE